MAAPHAFLTYSIQDAKGETSVMKLNFPTSASFADISTFAVSMATVLNNLIMGKILSAGIGLEVDLSGATIRSSPLADSDVEEGARFSWRSAIGALTNFRIPTFDEAKLLSGTKQVDLADSDVDDMVDAIITGFGVGAGYVHPSDDHGSDIESLETARESFTSSRN